LFEEVRHTLRSAQIAKLDKPLSSNGTVTWTALAPGYEPIDPREVQTFESAEQGLSGDEPHRSRYVAKAIGTSDKAPVLDRDTHPNVLWPRQERR
jgi:hypothetical protein